VSCHQGINVGGNLFQRYGVMEDPFGGREIAERDYGRMLLTGRQEDAHVFRVPSLRNVALTAPYFHDGSAATLEAAVEHMGRVQLGIDLDKNDVAAIAAFLRTLTGEIGGRP
jgi:cytochrome c peroxidase